MWTTRCNKLAPKLAVDTCLLIVPCLLISYAFGGPGFCPMILHSQVTNVNDKMASMNPDGGGDLMWGTGVCTIYLKPYDEAVDTVESAHNDFGIKIVMHEYIHCIQQGLVSGDVSLTKTYASPTVTVENPCDLPQVYADKTVAAFASLPKEWKVINKVVVFYGACPKKSYSTGELQKFYGDSCPGMAPYNHPGANLNVFGEGEAEYHSLNTLMPVVTASWTTPFAAVQYWNDRVAEGKSECGLPGNTDFKFGSGSEAHIEARLLPSLKKAGYEHCRNNYIGEAVVNFLLTSYRPETTRLELFTIWHETLKLGFGGAWEEVIGSSWSDFIEAMEKNEAFLVDPESTGSPGQPLEPVYIEELLTAVIVATVFCGIFVFCAIFMIYRDIRDRKKKKETRSTAGNDDETSDDHL
jgi:hypothetical protein